MFLLYVRSITPGDDTQEWPAEASLAALRSYRKSSEHALHDKSDSPRVLRWQRRVRITMWFAIAIGVLSWVASFVK
jgi:hypothetical protein